MNGMMDNWMGEKDKLFFIHHSIHPLFLRGIKYGKIEVVEKFSKPEC